jgi:hypothetical protein
LLLKGEIEMKSGNFKVASNTLESLFVIPGIKIGQSFPKIEGMFSFGEQVL